MNIYIYFHSGNTIDEFLEYYCIELSKQDIPPKLYMLEDHGIVKDWFRNKYCWMQLFARRLRTCHYSIIGASIEKAKQLHSKINFTKEGEQHCNIANN